MPDRFFPAFRPHLLLAGGHLQTCAAFLFPGTAPTYAATPCYVALPDGDQIVLHDDCPATWQPRDRVALLIHGLAGCHESPYVRRVAARLNERGVRTFRKDLRGCGAGARLARLPYHSGRSEDAAAAIQAIARICPDSPVTVIGFSLGGNITLKMLGEAGDALPGSVDSAVAVCPPIDLMVCIRHLQRPANRLYDRHFVRMLLGQMGARLRLRPDAATVVFPRRPRGLLELDDWFTAPVSGFGRAENYYRLCSANQFLPAIRVPTLLVASRDDPLVPFGPFEQARLSSAIELLATDRGGHVGFIGARGADRDRRWLDWRIVEWVMSR
jgi:predicted alpha/beta-fold hydrolase